MSDQKQCSHCGADFKPGDKFCPLCGEPRRPAEEVRDPGPERDTCPSCGHQQPHGEGSCGSCGASLGKSSAGVRKEPVEERAGADVPFLQSWKFTLAAAALFALIIVFFISIGNDPARVESVDNPHDAAMMEQIQMFQDQIDSNPSDTAALLNYANLLFDVRFFQRAVEMYGRYLGLNPANADARVDMGIAFFELSLADSGLHDRYMRSARTAFEEALSYQPEHQLAHFNLGIIHLHQGDMEGANTWFRKCIAISPGTDAARRAAQILSQHVQQKPS